jgi:hypothetical protein
MPPSLEQSVLGDAPYFFGPLQAPLYIATKALEGLSLPMSLPEGNGRVDKSNAGPGQRRTAAAFRTVDEATVSALRARAREEGTTVGAALAAAAALSTSDILPAKDDSSKRNFKVLQSLNMRAYGADKGDTVSCQAGSMDLMLGANARGGEAIRSGGGVDGLDDFWSMAREAQAQLKSFVDKGYPKDAVGVFDWMMKVSELTNLVRCVTLGHPLVRGTSLSPTTRHPPTPRYTSRLRTLALLVAPTRVASLTRVYSNHRHHHHHHRHHHTAPIRWTPCTLPYRMLGLALPFSYHV